MMKNVNMNGTTNRTLAVIDGGLNVKADSEAADESKTEIVAASEASDSRTTLQSEDRGHLCLLDQAVHLFP
jgi:hypothetical protein